MNAVAAVAAAELTVRIVPEVEGAWWNKSRVELHDDSGQVYMKQSVVHVNREALQQNRAWIEALFLAKPYKEQGCPQHWNEDAAIALATEVTRRFDPDAANDVPSCGDTALRRLNTYRAFLLHDLGMSEKDFGVHLETAKILGHVEVVVEPENAAVRVQRLRQLKAAADQI